MLTLAPRAFLLGLEITDLVVGWGDTEQVKDVLLGQTQLFTSALKLEVENRGGFLSPAGSGSLLRGVRWYNREIRINVDGLDVYVGLIRSAGANPPAGTALLDTENVLKIPAETIYSGSATGVNPAYAMLGILGSALPSVSIDAASFAAAAGPAARARATLDYTYAATDGATVLSVLQELQQLASISVFVAGGRVRAKAFRPYRGDEAGLGPEISDALVRSWGQLTHDYANFNNQVVMTYAGGGQLVRDDKVSQAQTGVVRSFPFPNTAKAIAHDRASAEFFCAQYLGRSGRQRAVLPVAGGREFSGIRVGDRFPVTSPSRLGLGWNRLAMEAIEVKPLLAQQEVDLLLAELPIAAN